MNQVVLRFAVFSASIRAPATNKKNDCIRLLEIAPYLMSIDKHKIFIKVVIVYFDYIILMINKYNKINRMV